MIGSSSNIGKPLELLVTGEAETWLPQLGQIVGPQFLHMQRVRSDQELLNTIRNGQVDAAILDEGGSGWDMDVLPLLRIIRRENPLLPVVVVTQHTDRRWLENALRLAAFSVVVKPIELEEFIRQIHGIMIRLAKMLDSE